MIALSTNDPSGLLEAIYEGIKNKNDEGGIRTWIRDENGHLRHDTSSEDNDWVSKASFKPIECHADNTLILALKWHNHGFDRVVYSVYHGRFIEMILAHFSDLCLIDEVSVKPHTGTLNEYLESRRGVQ